MKKKETGNDSNPDGNLGRNLDGGRAHRTIDNRERHSSGSLEMVGAKKTLAEGGRRSSQEERRMQKTQILVYEGGKGGIYQHQNKTGNVVVNMHQTLPQMQMPPIEITATAHSFRTRLPPKSLLFKGKSGAGGSRGDSKTGRTSLKHRSDLSLSEH